MYDKWRDTARFFSPTILKWSPRSLDYDDMIYTPLLNSGRGYCWEVFGGVMPPGSLNP